MVANISEAVQKIKQAGACNARIVPMAGQDTLKGLQQIEVNEGGSWKPVATGLTRKLAEDVIAQATNRVICG